MDQLDDLLKAGKDGNKSVIQLKVIKICETEMP
jgi:hypothetical protein